MEITIKDNTDKYCEMYSGQAPKKNLIKHIEEVDYDKYNVYHVDQGAFIRTTKDGILYYLNKMYGNKTAFDMFPDEFVSFFTLKI